MSGAAAMRRAAGHTSWQTIRDEVLARVRGRTWKPGEPIPNEADLAIEFGCARATVNRALRDLAAAGVLERRRRAGTRVAATPSGRAQLAIPLIHRDVETSGASYSYRLIAATIALPPPPIRLRMQIAPSRTALHVRSLHLADSLPHVYEDRWINPATVAEILAVDLRMISANAWLVQNTPFSEGDMRFGAVAADGEVAGHLAVAPGAALLLIERSTWQDGQALTFVRQFYTPGHWIEADLTTG